MKRALSTTDLIDTTAAQWIARRDAGLTAAEADELGHWSQQDERHADALARYEATWTAISRPRRADASAELARELAGLQHRRRARLLGAAGAAAVLLLAAGWLWNPRVGRETAPAAGRIVMLIPEQRTLPDGSVVELKSGAEISVDFTDALRRVRLIRGEAHFAVAKNPARPFLVEAGAVTVRAVGTAFAVQRSANAIDLIVTEGRVSVDRPMARDITSSGPSDGADAPAPKTSLAFVDAGQRVDIVSNTAGQAPLQIRSVSAEEIAQRLAWRARRAEFSGTPLAEVVALLNRHTRERFVIEDPELARVPLSGLFLLEDGAAFVRMLETGFGVQTERLGGEVIVLRRRR